MSTEEIFATGRVVERLMICVFAGLSLTYGWNLFRVGVLTEQSAELAANGWRVNLKRVGPGAFFALFGSVVLAVSLRSPLTFPLNSCKECSNKTSNADAGKTQPQKDQAQVIYLEGADENVTKQWVASLNTILYVATPDKFSSATEKKVVARTDEDLETLRNTLVIKKFGAPLFRDYNAYRKKLRDDGVQGTRQEQEKFEQIDEWMQGNRIQE
jgi:hypothetical protein